MRRSQGRWNVHDEEPTEPLGPGDPLARFVEHQRALRMDPQAKSRVAAKLGVGGGGGGPSASLSTTRLAATAGMAVVVSLLALVGWSAWSGPGPRSDGAPPSSPAPPRVPVAARAQIPLEAPTTEPPSLEAPPPPPEPAAQRRPRPRPDAVEAPSEIELLSRARAELAAHPRVTLRLCADHEALHPDGVLREEREVLAIDALLATGAHPQAEARAARFAREFPRSVHQRHVTQALAEASRSQPQASGP